MSETTFSREAEPTEVDSDIQIYKEIEHFASSVYPHLLQLADKIAQGPDQAVIEEIQSLVINPQQETIFSKSLYDRLLGDAELGATLRHDTAGSANTFLLHLGLLREFTPSKPRAWERFTRSLKAFLKVCPRYFLVLEDILLRKIEKSSKEVPVLPLNTIFADQALTELRNSREVEGRVQSLFGEEASAEKGSVASKPLQHFSSLNNGEQIMAPTGEVMNAIFNIIRNASKIEVGAEHAACEISRVGNEIIVHVIDDGHGMSGDQLEHIFKKGVSFTGSTGLGLAGLDARFARRHIRLFIASRRKTNQPGDAMTFAEAHMYPSHSAEATRLQSFLTDRNAATIFEIRLPITKKEH